MAGLAGSLLLMLMPPPFARPISARRAGALRVVFLDVGQGDCTLIELPISDSSLSMPRFTGTGFDIGERVVTPALLALGARSIDTLVLTHGDPDHIGGAPAGCGISHLIRSGKESRFRRILACAIWRQWRLGLACYGAPCRRPIEKSPAVRKYECSIRRFQSGSASESATKTRSFLKSVSVRFDSPARRHRPRGRAAPTAHLATGPLTIVKAPHHGSATSRTQPFIDALHPSVVIFSAGRANRFGHPAPAVVARYRAAKSLIFRTDEDGAIVLDTDGKSVEMWTWSGRRVRLR